MITRAEWEERQQQWAEFNRWEESQPPVEHSDSYLIAAAGALYEWLPKESRTPQDDPERTGIQRMHFLLSLLKRDDPN